MAAPNQRRNHDKAVHCYRTDFFESGFRQGSVFAGVRVGSHILVSGIIGVDSQGRIPADFRGQVEKVLATLEAFADPVIAQFWNPIAAAGRAALDAMITQQAQIIAYIDDYKLLMIATLAVIPLLIVFTKPSAGGGPDHAVVAEQ